MEREEKLRLGCRIRTNEKRWQRSSVKLGVRLIHECRTIPYRFIALT